ncbi:hypothetical protein [Candidatus Enterococcus murrayae]|nr:hypothetical protein [Enterococcus sp. MJM16]
MWLMEGVKFRSIVFLGIVYVIGNLLCETLMTFLNTPDIVDAYFGFLGTLIAFIYLLITKRFGLMPIRQKG